jgi:hypothetical protein
VSSSCPECNDNPCYACLVGVWTGPESHSCCCPSREVSAAVAVEHRIFVNYGVRPDDFASWECSCGKGGSAPDWRVDEASQRHVSFRDRVVSISKPEW